MSEISNDLLVRKGEAICLFDELDHLHGKRFQIRCSDIKPFEGMNADPEDSLPAFVLRKDERIVAYLNRCAHLPMEMDWNPGMFFDEDFSYIVCSTHYALYEIDTGICVRGPCPKGAKLIPLKIDVEAGKIVFLGS
jgi:nitrite reductase/ring-hydroxylating ferredoxin subunit